MIDYIDFVKTFNVIGERGINCPFILWNSYIKIDLFPIIPSNLRQINKIFSLF